MLNLTNLKIRRMRGNLIQLFKIINGYETINFENSINFPDWCYIHICIAFL